MCETSESDNMHIVFRTDSASHIGYGHLWRCLALAQALKHRGHVCQFICRNFEKAGIDLIMYAGFECLLLPPPVTTDLSAEKHENSAYRDWLGVTAHEDAQQTRALLCKMPRCDWLIVDSYSLDAHWHETLAGCCHKLMVIDDLADRAYYCDLLLDQSNGESPLRYHGFLQKPAELLMGSQYALIRADFARLRSAALRKRRETTCLKRLLITMGGTDPENLSLDILKAVTDKGFTTVEQIDVVLTRSAPHLTALRDFLRGYQTHAQVPSPAVHLLTDVHDMAHLILEADFAIGTAGVSAWERCVLGLPSLVMIAGDDQHSVAAVLQQYQAAIVLERDHGTGAEHITRTLNALLEDLPFWHRLSRAAFVLCDGQGTTRVTNRLEQL